MVAGHIAVISVGDVVGGVAVPIPDVLALAVFIPGAFDLVSRSRRAPDKVVGKFLNFVNL